MTWMFWPLALLMGPMLLAIGLIYFLAMRHRRAPKRSPLTRDLLRSPGEHLRAQIEDLNLDFGGYLATIIALPPLLYSLYLANPDTARSPTTTLIIAIISGFVSVAYVLFKMTRTFFLRRRLHLGYEAEVAVGQELNQLLRDQYWVFHDVPFERFNIDHVVVGRTGVFAVETKGRAKPLSKDGKVSWEVNYDGKRLQFPGWTETAPIQQAQCQADALRNWLTAAVGEALPVQPVLVLPGWYIKRTAAGGVPMFNGTHPSRFFRDIGKAQLPNTLIQRIAHQLEQKCRNIEPKAYGQQRAKKLT